MRNRTITRKVQQVRRVPQCTWLKASDFDTKVSFIFLYSGARCSRFIPAKSLFCIPLHWPYVKLLTLCVVYVNIKTIFPAAVNQTIWRLILPEDQSELFKLFFAHLVLNQMFTAEILLSFLLYNRRDWLAYKQMNSKAWEAAQKQTSFRNLKASYNQLPSNVSACYVSLFLFLKILENKWASWLNVIVFSVDFEEKEETVRSLILILKVGVLAKSQISSAHRMECWYWLSLAGDDWQWWPNHPNKIKPVW